MAARPLASAVPEKVATGQSSPLARLLATSGVAEPLRKKPRLQEGANDAWEAQFKQLDEWLEANLAVYRLHSKLGAAPAPVKDVDAVLGRLERFWANVVALT